MTSVRAPGAPFRIDNNLCSGRTLAPGATCQVTVAFTPQTVGSFSATLQIDAGADASTSTLEGTGVPAAPTTTVVGPTTSTTRSGQSTTSTGPATTGPSIPPTTVPGVTTTGASGTTTSSLPDDQRLLECERQARDAKVFYAPTQKMGKDETQQVQVSASIGPATDTTSSPTTGAVSTTVVPVQLRCEVQAELRGEDFRVNPDGFQGGSFLDRPVVTWSWDVVPLKAGTRVLTLEIRSVADIEGRRIEGAGGQLFTTSIDVGVKPENLGEKVTRWSKAVVDHPLVRGFGSLAVHPAALAAGWRWLLKRPWPWTKPGLEDPVAGVKVPAPDSHASQPRCFRTGNDVRTPRNEELTAASQATRRFDVVTQAARGKHGGGFVESPIQDRLSIIEDLALVGCPAAFGELLHDIYLLRAGRIGILRPSH